MLVALVMLLHEAVEPLRIVAGQLARVGVQERIELLHQHIEIPTWAFALDRLVGRCIEDALGTADAATSRGHALSRATFPL